MLYLSQGLNFVSTSLKPMDGHISFQTDWMARNLITRYKDNEVYDGGLLSDVTYRVFRNGYLMTTSMYQMDLERWAPVLFTWMLGLETQHYKAHFVALLDQINLADMGPFEKDQLTRQVVDFSGAQKNGFINAYMQVFPSTTRDEALSRLKGCREHFRQSVTRIKRNRSMIPAPMEVGFFFLSVSFHFFSCFFFPFLFFAFLLTFFFSPSSSSYIQFKKKISLDPVFCIRYNIYGLNND